MPDLEADLTLMADLARVAGQRSLDFLGKPVKVWKKLGDEPVCEADYAVNEILKDGLTGARPDYGWLSEENEDDPARLSCERVFIVDPIDGTRAFLRGGDDFCISTALIERGRPIAAVIYQPVHDRMLTATADGGAFDNGTPLSAPDRLELEGCVMAGNINFFASNRFWPVPWPEMSIRQMNSIALRVAFVGTGDVDACVALRPKNDWDLAAADLIVTEAGGTVVDEDGKALMYNHPRPRQRNVIACSGALLKPVLERVRAALMAYRTKQSPSS